MTTPRQHWSDEGARQPLPEVKWAAPVTAAEIISQRREQRVSTMSPDALRAFGETFGLGRDTPRPRPKRPLWWVAWLIVLVGLVAVLGPLFWGKP